MSKRRRLLHCRARSANKRRPTKRAFPGNGVKLNAQPNLTSRTGTALHDVLALALLLVFAGSIAGFATLMRDVEIASIARTYAL